MDEGGNEKSPQDFKECSVGIPCVCCVARGYTGAAMSKATPVEQSYPRNVQKL
jgi:hypothetical protein